MLNPVRSVDFTKESLARTSYVPGDSFEIYTELLQPRTFYSVNIIMRMDHACIQSTYSFWNTVNYSMRKLNGKLQVRLTLVDFYIPPSFQTKMQYIQRQEMHIYKM